MHYFIFFLSFVVHPYFPDRMGCPRGLQFLMFHYVIFLGVNFEEEQKKGSPIIPKLGQHLLVMCNIPNNDLENMG